MQSVRITFIIVIILLAFSAYSQPYESIFGKNSTMWIFEWSNSWGLSQDTIFVEKDTIYKGDTWKKVICSNSQYYKGALIKEDTLSGKIWYKSFYNPQFPGNDTSIQLAFDFSLQKGDTFNLDCVWGIIPDSLSVVDTTYYKNDRKFIEFKVYHFNSKEPYTFIEGIGGIFGIIYKQNSGILMAHYLLCTYKDDTISYTNNHFHPNYKGKCDVHSGLVKPQARDFQIKIYPNPFIKFITVEKDINLSIEKIEIFNMNWEMVYTGIYSQFIDLGFLPAGLYSVRFTTEHDEYLFNRILKH